MQLIVNKIKVNSFLLKHIKKDFKFLYLSTSTIFRKIFYLFNTDQLFLISKINQLRFKNIN